MSQPPPHLSRDLEPPQIPTREQLREIQAPVHRIGDLPASCRPLLDAVDIKYVRISNPRRGDYLEVNIEAHEAIVSSNNWISDNVLGGFGNVWVKDALHNITATPAFIELSRRLLGIESWDEARVEMLRAELIMVCQHRSTSEGP